jgi:hypothetical protein
MSNRRTFVRQVVGGGTGMALSGGVSSGRAPGANDRLPFALIGAGDRALQYQSAFMRIELAPDQPALVCLAVDSAEWIVGFSTDHSLSSTLG